MLSAIGRAAIRRVVTRGSTTSTRALLTHWQHETGLPRRVLQELRRSYVAASVTKVGEKKAKTTTGKKPSSATRRAKSKTIKSKKPAAKKTKKTKAKAKVKVKTQRKPVSEKTRARKEASDRALLRKELQEQALIAKEPKKAPTNVWRLYMITQLPKKLEGSLTEHVKVISEQYKNLSIDEKEVDRYPGILSALLILPPET